DGVGRRGNKKENKPPQLDHGSHRAEPFLCNLQARLNLFKSELQQREIILFKKPSCDRDQKHSPLTAGEGRCVAEQAEINSGPLFFGRRFGRVKYWLKVLTRRDRL